MILVFGEEKVSDARRRIGFDNDVNVGVVRLACTMTCAFLGMLAASACNDVENAKILEKKLRSLAVLRDHFVWLSHVHKMPL